MILLHHEKHAQVDEKSWVKTRTWIPRTSLRRVSKAESNPSLESTKFGKHEVSSLFWCFKAKAGFGNFEELRLFRR